MKRLEELGKRHYWTDDEIIKASHVFDGMSRWSFRMGNPAAFSAARRRGLLNSMTWLKEKMVFHSWNATTLRDIDNIKWFANNHGYLMANVNGRDVLKHRLVMEIILGRKLDTDECVHHKDGNKLNSDPNNLEIINRSDHTIFHNKTTRFYKRGYRCHISEEGRRIRIATCKRNCRQISMRFEQILSNSGMSKTEWKKMKAKEYRDRTREKRLSYAHAYYQSHKIGWNKKKEAHHA